MDTLTRLNEAASRAEELAVLNDSDAEDYFRSIGLDEEEVVHEFVQHQVFELFKLKMLLGGGITFENLGTVSMMFGILVGYQLALARESE